MRKRKDAAQEQGCLLDAVISALEAEISVISDVLEEPPPRNRAILEAALHNVQRQIARTPPALADINRAKADAIRASTEEDPRGRAEQAWYDIGHRLGAFQVALNQWPRVERLIRSQLYEPRHKLISPSRHAFSASQVALGDDIFDHLHRILNPLGQDKAVAEQGAYADIGLPQSRFVALAHAAYRVALAQGRASMDFLDVGCGMGLKLVSAARFFDGVAGIELDPGYAERARQFLTAAAVPKASIVETDARVFEHYNEFDVIYLFRPIEDHVAMAVLEFRIAEKARPGTLIIGPYRGLAARHREIGLWPLSEGLYLTGGTRAEAVSLRRRSEHIGPAVRPPADRLPNVWTPVLRISHRNGFDMGREGRLDHV